MIPQGCSRNLKVRYNRALLASAWNSLITNKRKQRVQATSKHFFLPLPAVNFLKFYKMSSYNAPQL